METGGTAPAVFNAANEVAVSAFLASRIPFLAISEIVEQTVTLCASFEPADLGAVLGADAEARRVAEARINHLKSRP